MENIEDIMRKEAWREYPHCRKCCYRAGDKSVYLCDHTDIAGVTRMKRGLDDGIATVDETGQVHFPVEDCPYWKDKRAKKMKNEE